MYASYFGLDREPFDLADSSVFIAFPGNAQALSCLHSGLALERSTLLLSGKHGIGKTTLLRRLKHELAAKMRVLMPHANADWQAADLVDHIAGNLSIPAAGSVASLVEQIAANPNRTRELLLIIDDAESLSADLLSAVGELAAINTGGRPLLKVILAATPALSPRLQTEAALAALNKEIVRRCDLLALEAEDLPRYTQKRLAAAGANRTDVFQPDALQRLAELSGGIPRRINRIADQALLLAYLGSETHVSAPLIRKVSGTMPSRIQPPPPAESEPASNNPIDDDQTIVVPTRAIGLEENQDEDATIIMNTPLVARERERQHDDDETVVIKPQTANDDSANTSPLPQAVIEQLQARQASREAERSLIQHAPEPATNFQPESEALIVPDTTGPSMDTILSEAPDAPSLIADSGAIPHRKHRQSKPRSRFAFAFLLLVTALGLIIPKYVNKEENIPTGTSSPPIATGLPSPPPEPTQAIVKPAVPTPQVATPETTAAPAVVATPTAVIPAPTPEISTTEQSNSPIPSPVQSPLATEPTVPPINTESDDDILRELEKTLERIDLMLNEEPAASSPAPQ